MQVTASAPGKLMLSGSYAVVHGEGAVVSAVDQRLTVTVRKNGVDVFHMDAPDVGLSAYSKTIQDLGKYELPAGVRFIEILYKNFLEKHPQQEGIVVTTKSDFSSKFGFGSSSGATVAFAKALITLYDIPMSNKELFDLCYASVLEVQGVGSGFDIASAIWGGTIYYVAPAKEVVSINISKLPIIVGYTGVKADTPTLINMVNSKLNRREKAIREIFETIGQVSISLKEALSENDLQKAGTLLTQHQTAVAKLGVSSMELEKLITAATEAGAYGATLSGAGGGDCMVALTDEKNRKAIEQAISNAGGEVMHVTLHAEGVRVENSN